MVIFHKGNKVNKPKATWRVITSVVLAFVFYTLNSTYNVFRASYEAGLAVKQVDDSVVSYSLIQQLITNNAVHQIIVWVFILCILLIWGLYVKKMLAFNRQANSN